MKSSDGRRRFCLTEINEKRIIILEEELTRILVHTRWEGGCLVTESCGTIAAINAHPTMTKTTGTIKVAITGLKIVQDIKLTIER